MDRLDNDMVIGEITYEDLPEPFDGGQFTRLPFRPGRKMDAAHPKILTVNGQPFEEWAAERKSANTEAAVGGLAVDSERIG